jgi:hypothetical protein
VISWAVALSSTLIALLAQPRLHDAGGSSKLAVQRQELVSFVADIKRADYEGNPDQLQRRYDTIPTEGQPPLLEARLRYWKGFAKWRRAIKGLNESVQLIVLRLAFDMEGEFLMELAFDPARRRHGTHPQEQITEIHRVG